VTASSPAAITYGTAVPAITYTLNPAAATFTTNPTCSVYATADTTFATPLTGVQNAGSYVTHCAGGVSANYTPTYVNGALTINKAAVTVTASSPAAITTAVAVPAITYTLNPTAATFTTNPTCGVYATAASTTVLTGTQAAGTYVTKCSGGVSTNYTPTYVNGSLVVQSVPTVVFTGTQVINTGGTMTLSATSTPNTCTGAITYALDRNPTNGAAGPFTLGASPVATTGWQDGTYLITMSKAATATCAAVSITSATVTFAATTNRAYGGGQYTVAGTPRVSASFQVGPSTTAVSGQFKFVQTNTWQFIGTLTTYSRTGTTGTATGTGNLSYWNTTLNGGAGGWTSVGAAIPVRIVFVAGTTTGTLSTTFTYTPTTGQPVLPTTAAQTLGRVVANA
jgi:putative component of membrane protein insertase Oxa1/YidC/SpoIIIJ protein YidD